ncbi:MAG: tetratricopeptide repeat protein [Bacteroidia bacterium]|nr:tetratricopeptide repeat protein [Bacteroidia bacterium]
MKKSLKFTIFFLTIVLFGNFGTNAGNVADSLLSVYKNASSDTSRIKALIDIGNNYRGQNPDSALSYYRKASGLAEKAGSKKFQALAVKNQGIIFDLQHDFDKAREKYLNALEIYSSIPDKDGMAACRFNIGLSYYNQGRYADANALIQQALELYRELKEPAKQAHCYSNLGNIAFQQGNYPQAINSYQEAMKKFEEAGNSNGVADSYNNIGNIYYRQRNFAQAGDCYDKALSKYHESGNTMGVVLCYNNLGLISNDQKAYKKAVDYFQKALEISEKSGNRKEFAICYSNIGMAYYSGKNLNKAIEFFNKALVICEETGDKLKTAVTLGNIAKIYNTLGDSVTNVVEKKKHYSEAIKYALRSDSIAEGIGALHERQQACSNLSASYEGLGDYKTSLRYHILYTTIKDTLVNMETNRLVSDMSAKYESEKKELLIGKLSKEKEFQVAENKKQRILIFSFIAGFIIIAFFLIMIFRQYKQIKKANKLLAEQKHEIEDKNEELNQQNEEIRTQRDEIEVQRDQITKIHREITDSIHYAERIQKAILPQLEENIPLIKDMFIMFKPKDVVSGDFYFMRHIESSNVLVAAAADCTGHGVPGAFMSMLGVTFLNEICLNPEIQHSGEVLDLLRKYIITSLHQTGKFGEQKDGMDISLVAIFIDKRELEFSGANNPLYLIRDNELIEYKGNKMPIGIHDKANQPFASQLIKIQDGDCIYMSSDGFSDQFGGEDGKKYMTKNFKKFLHLIHQKLMDEQRILVEKESIDWRGKNEQIDDQLVMGIRF